MTVTNGLCTEADIRAVALPTGAAFPDTPRLELAINSASRRLEQYTDRVFTTSTDPSVRYFVADPWTVPGWQGLAVDDFYFDTDFTSADLVVETGDGLGNWTALTTYQLEPLNGILNGQAWPYTTIRALNGFRWPHRGDEALVRVTAKWGWPEVPDGMRAAAVAQTLANFKSPENPLGYSDTQAGPMSVSQYLHPTAKLLAFPYCKNPYGS